MRANIADEQPGQIVGTPVYMSPEQASGGSAGPASDVFQLGAILFQLLCGGTRLDGHGRSRPSAATVLAIAANEPHPEVRSRRPRAPRWLAAVADQALRSDPLRRYADAGEFALALEDALSRSS